MSYGWPGPGPRPPTVPWLRAIRELFTDQRAVTKDGVGANLTEAIVMLAEATHELVEVLKTFKREE